MADFGLASFYDHQSVMSTICGTAEYLSPEMLDQLDNSGVGYGPEVKIHIRTCNLIKNFDL